MHKLISWAAAALALALLPLVPAQAHAQGYPNKPIRFIVPYPAGGGTGITAKLGAEIARILKLPDVAAHQR